MPNWRLGGSIDSGVPAGSAAVPLTTASTSGAGGNPRLYEQHSTTSSSYIVPPTRQYLAKKRLSTISSYNYDIESEAEQRSITSYNPPKVVRMIGLGITVTENLRKKDFWRAVFAEFTGTLLLLFLAVGGIVVNFSHKAHVTEQADVYAHIRVALAFGTVIGGIVFCFGHISAHINPAFTLAAFILGKISLVRAAIFVVVQCLGALAGSALLYGIVPYTRENHFMCTRLDPSIRPIEGFGVELAITAVLVFGALAIVTKLEQSGASPGTSAVGILVLVTLLICIGGPVTGASMNPARSLGPAIILQGDCWNHHWVYWLGPLGGGIVAAICFKIALKDVQRRAPSVKRLARLSSYCVPDEQPVPSGQRRVAEPQTPIALKAIPESSGNDEELAELQLHSG